MDGSFLLAFVAIGVFWCLVLAAAILDEAFIGLRRRFFPDALDKYVAGILRELDDSRERVYVKRVPRVDPRVLDFP